MLYLAKTIPLSGENMSDGTDVRKKSASTVLNIWIYDESSAGHWAGQAELL